jgi:hypothetical protein
MPSPITEEAIKIIDGAPAYGPLKRPAEYAEALPPEAGALARVLSSTKFQEEAERYQEADKSAVRAQRWHLWLARTALFSVFPSVVLGGVSVYMSTSAGAPAIEAVRPYLVPAQALFVSASFVCAIALLLFAPRRRWLGARARAELHRWVFFRRLMSAPGSAEGAERPLLPLQLECFRRHLFEDQHQFFDARVQRYRSAARVGRLFGAVALLLVGMASLPQLAASLSELGAFDWLPERLQRFLALLVGDKRLYALAWLYGISLQLVVTRLAFISPVARHVERYEVMGALLSRRSQLAEARNAAAMDNRAPAEWFTRDVLDILETEHRMWIGEDEQAKSTGT